MKSNLKNMVLVLLVITLVSSAAVGLVYKYTLDPITKAKQAKLVNALAAVLPPFDNNPVKDAAEVTEDGMQITVYRASNGGDLAGYAVQTVSPTGYAGPVSLLVGFDAAGSIVDIAVLEQSETPGLGAKMAEPDNKLVVSFRGKNPAELQMAVTKDGGDIDALTASTISSRAYVDAVARAYKALQQVKGGQGDE